MKKSIQPWRILTRLIAIIENVNHHNITYEQFHAAIQNDKIRITTLRKKYPQMKAYLVIALRGEQAHDFDHWENILREFPSLVTGEPDAENLRLRLAPRFGLCWGVITNVKPSEDSASRLSRQIGFQPVFLNQISLLDKIIK